MGDENPIRTLGDYSKPSHEGYRNTIELPVGNNVVPLRSADENLRELSGEEAWETIENFSQGHSGSLGVDFLKLEMIEDDLELEYKEVYFLGRGLKSPVRPKEVEKVIFDEKKLGSS
ncbi:hypothetical protein Tco_0803871 [Tanacetum coccineum]|uniref:Uncharacterized protein n=1 Tax=Tanacetum coccineum TaxID=301880 RepID=A0ABQ5A788_9ASTR